MSQFIEENLDHDGIDRRGFLKCMAWAGTGTLCLLQGGVLKSYALSDVLQQKVEHLKGDLSFVQISDSHIGFNKAANPDVTATLHEAIAKINALPDAAGLRHPHRRPHAPVEAGRVRHAGPNR